jgi:putative transposase
MYHLVCPIKYRKKILSDDIVTQLKVICLEIQSTYEIYFLEVGCDTDHVHFLIQLPPTTSPQSAVQKIKSITARELFKNNHELKQELWGGKFWTAGYFINTVGRAGSEKTIRNYVKSQGKEQEYIKIYQSQLTLF